MYENYLLKDGKVFRKKRFCEKSKKMLYEKELKIQLIKGYKYLLINGKLTNFDRVFIQLKSKPLTDLDRLLIQLKSKSIL